MAIRSLSPDEISARMRDLFAQAQAIKGRYDDASFDGVPALSSLGVAGIRQSTRAGGSEEPTSDKLDFQAVLKDAIRGVSDAQNSAEAKAQAYQLGDDKVSLEEVMISLQRASLAMQGMVQVRNRLVDAYKEVMNMQV